MVSDWFATHSAAKAAMARLGQQQPGSEFFGAPLKKAADGGQVPMTRLNEMVHRILRTELAGGIIDHPQLTRVPDAFRASK